jgi:hypothetical protein
MRVSSADCRSIRLNTRCVYFDNNQAGMILGSDAEQRTDRC